jgi:O-antigen/teichoic acid export membrane protein
MLFQTSREQEVITGFIAEQRPRVSNTESLGASPSLRGNVAWSLAGNTVYAGCQWAILIVLAKLGTPVLVGQFALGLAVTAPVFAFLNLQLRDIQATDARRQFLFGDYLGLRLLMLLWAPLVIGVAALTAGYRGSALLIIGALTVAKLIESISDVFYGLLQQNERMDRISISMILKGTASLIALGLAVLWTGSAVWGATALAVAWALILFTYDIPSGNRIATISRAMDHAGDRILPRWRTSALLKLASLAVPLGIVMTLTSLCVNIPRYFVEHYAGERGLGIFASIVALQVPGLTVMRALAHSALPRLGKYYVRRNRSAFRRLLLQLVGLATALGASGVIVAVLAGRQVLTLVYGAEYGEHAEVLIWVMLGAGVGYIAGVLYYAMTAARQVLVQIPLFAIVAVSATLFSFWMVPVNALRGGAVALLAAWLAQAAGACGILLYADRGAQASLTGQLPGVSGEVPAVCQRKEKCESL